MPSLLVRAKGAFAGARSRSPLVDHLTRMQEHYSRVNAGSQAGAVTYFAFLSFFPILALAFVVVGYLARYFPDAQNNLVDPVSGQPLDVHVMTVNIDPVFADAADVLFMVSGAEKAPALRDVIAGGDHVIVTGEVTGLKTSQGDPLVFHGGEYRPLD